MIIHNKQYYLNNAEYSRFLDHQDSFNFKKYTDYIIKYSKKDSLFLDIGCGTGLVLDLLKSEKIRAIGIDVSNTSIEICRKKCLDGRLYNGMVLPFNDQYFDIVGSYNVLEHVGNPIIFLNEMIRVLKKKGIMILVCPNFLSITSNYHYHTKGLCQKLKNFTVIFKKLFSSRYRFEKMNTVVREDFRPDDDACNVTNPIDILKWAREHNLKLQYWSSQPIYKKGIINYLDFSFLKLFLGSSFFIFRK